MKQVLFLAMCICLLAHNIFAQKAYIHGKIQNPLSDSIQINYTDRWMLEKNTWLSAKISPNGNFFICIPVNDEFIRVEIKHGNFIVDAIVEPGYKLILSMDTKHLPQSVKWMGVNANVLNLLSIHSAERGAFHKRNTKFRQFYLSEPDVFEKQVFDYYEEELMFLEKRKFNLPYTFYIYWKSMCKFDYYNLILNYPAFHNAKAEKRGFYNLPLITLTTYVPEDFDDYFLILPEYRSYVKNYVLKRIVHGDTLSKEQTLTRLRKILPSQTLEFLMASFIVGRQSENILNFSTQDLLNSYPNSQYANLILN